MCPKITYITIVFLCMTLSSILHEQNYSRACWIEGGLTVILLSNPSPIVFLQSINLTYKPHCRLTKFTSTLSWQNVKGMNKYWLKEVFHYRQQFSSKSPSPLPHACFLKLSQYKCIMLFHSITEDKQDSVSSSSITWKIWLSLVTSTTSPICGRKMFPWTTPSFFLQCSARASVASVVPRTSIFKQKIHL